MSGKLIFKRCAAAAAAAVVVAVFGCSAQWSEMESFVMSTVLTQRVQGSDEVCSANVEIAQNLENELSRTIDGSEVRRLVESDSFVPLSKDTQDVLRASLEAWKATDGAFDPALGAFRDAWDFSGTPRVPTEDELRQLLEAPGAEAIEIRDGEAAAGGADIDLGGAGKGIALDRMWEAMGGEGVENAIISFGGAVLAMGHREDGQSWQVGLRDPLSSDSGSWIAVIEMSDAIIETSGISEQSFTQNGITYHHLLDPSTGKPADNNLAAVSVAGSSGLQADIMSTALFVMGLDDGMHFADENEIKALFVTRDRQILKTDSFDYEIHDIDPSYTLA